MKRFFLGFGVFCAVALSALPLVVQAQDVDNFTIRSFQADYYLDKDAEGRSTLKTVEKITAVFPDHDQNHGLERALPKEYDGHSTDLRIQSVTDGSGSELEYRDSNSDGNLVLRIGDGDKYVHGVQDYIITYTQRDVTRFFNDTNADEFYWDVNGTQWSQPMETVSARVHVAASIASNLIGQTSCYQGNEGSTDTCDISRSDSGEGVVFSATVNGLTAFENMTVAIGFKPQTFAVYQPSAGEKLFATLVQVWIVLAIIGSVVATAMIVWMSIRRHKIMNRAKGRGTIVPEYLPPKDASVLLSAQVWGSAALDITAQIIDLAVRHYLKIYQTKEKTLFKSAEYELEIVKDPADLRPEERRLLEDIFGKENVVLGSRFAMKRLQNSYAHGQKFQASYKQILKDARTSYGLFERAEKEAKQFNKIGIGMIIVGVVTLSPLVIIAAITAFVFAHTLWPRTGKGVALHDYLAGLKLYISVAEEDRIKMLQSPEGAEKVGVSIKGDDPKQLIKLYERVLPYAVLLGIEKQWVKQLGAYYEQGATQPDWYSGNVAFNAAVFSSAMGGFSSSQSSYGSSASSSTGGSSGGGSSGGGGGGGGGGGW